ncbi:MAG: L-serine ammonia-lyase [Filomicrobium sp.]
MYFSVFQIFKPGIGPSSSHTMGPMTACAMFRNTLSQALATSLKDKQVTQIRCHLFGSLAFTGEGHGTDRAACLGLLGFQPDDVCPDLAAQRLSELAANKCLELPTGRATIAFDPDTDIVFDYDQRDLPHPNTMCVQALDAKGEVCLEETYCSIGGGFVVTRAEIQSEHKTIANEDAPTPPHSFCSMAELLNVCTTNNLSIAEVMRQNELAAMSSDDLNHKLDHILNIMLRCIERGMSTEGILPGGLGVKRRASDLKNRLDAERHKNEARPHAANDWLCAYAMAVNEENAAGNQIVTAPTNGAAGVVPAVLRYYKDHIAYPNDCDEDLRKFLLVAAAVGGIIKQRASISGAEVGCQGEVGSASAMAAAGLCSALGGTNEQIENASEIALEHHLGMTCDPVRGLVQVPCIERNAFGAIKALTAASLALHGDGSHVMPLDNCIEAMRQTGLEMSSNFKETSQGGLAVNLPEC